MGDCQDIRFFARLIFLLVACSASGELIAAAEPNFYEYPGVRSSDILKARGYLAEDLFIDTMDGQYKLKVTRGRNPLIEHSSGCGRDNTKVPILFLHGILEDSNIFLINSFDAKPRDLSHMDLTNFTIEQLNEQLGDDPAAKSLPLLALNLGHEVFIMSRRGFPGSQNMGDNRMWSEQQQQQQPQPREDAPDMLRARDALRRIAEQFANTSTGLRGLEKKAQSDNVLTSMGKYILGPFSAYLASLLEIPSSIQQVPLSFSSRFYNFSLDEQALYDFPSVVQFVLNQTGCARLAVVAHSAGGAITLMSLSSYPELADKISSATLWAEAFNLGDARIFRIVPIFLPLLDIYVGSFPPAFLTEQLTATLALICSAPGAEYTLCEGIADAILGPTTFQEPLKPEFFSAILGPTSPHELAQIIRAASYKLGTMHKFDYLSRKRNEIAYGQAKPPAYDLSKIKLSTMSFYAGGTDQVVAPSDVAKSIVQLSVPHRYHLVDTSFNHQGYFWHKNNSRLVVIPSMQELVELSQARGYSRAQ